MMESNNVVIVDFKNKKKTSTEAIATSVLVDQPLPQKEAVVNHEDEYTKFVIDPINANKMEFIITELVKTIASQYPDIITCTFGDVLFLKEGVISLIMRSWLKQEHPFQNMANNLEKTFNKNNGANNDAPK